MSQFFIKPTVLKPTYKWLFKSRGYIPDSYKPRVPAFFRHLLYRYDLHYTTLVLIVGQVRTGKSYLAMKIAEEYCKLRNIDPFDVRKQLSFDLMPFLKWAKTAKDSIYVIDEVGVSLNTMSWHDPLSITIHNFIQTQGFRRNVLILVLPNASFLLKKIRYMMNYIIETKYQGGGYIKRLSMDNVRSKGYFANMGAIRYKKPQKETCEIYERIKRAWNNAKLDEDIANLENPDQKPLDVADYPEPQLTRFPIRKRAYS